MRLMSNADANGRTFASLSEGFDHLLAGSNVGELAEADASLASRAIAGSRVASLPLGDNINARAFDTGGAGVAYNGPGATSHPLEDGSGSGKAGKTHQGNSDGGLGEKHIE